MQGDPEDGLIYALKNQVATLVLCSPPTTGSGSSKRSVKRSVKSNISAKSSCTPQSAAIRAAAVDDHEHLTGLQNEMPVASGPQWKAISKEVGKYYFRVPGVRPRSAQQLHLTRWLRVTVKTISLFPAALFWPSFLLSRHYITLPDVQGCHGLLAG